MECSRCEIIECPFMAKRGKECPVENMTDSEKKELKIDELKKSGAFKLGSFVKVKITDATATYLKSELLEE